MIETRKSASNGVRHYYKGQEVAVQLTGCRRAKGVLAEDYLNAHDAITRTVVLEPYAVMLQGGKSFRNDNVYRIEADSITGITLEPLNKMR